MYSKFNVIQKQLSIKNLLVFICMVQCSPAFTQGDSLRKTLITRNYAADGYNITFADSTYFASTWRKASRQVSVYENYLTTQEAGNYKLEGNRISLFNRETTTQRITDTLRMYLLHDSLICHSEQPDSSCLKYISPVQPSVMDKLELHYSKTGKPFEWNSKKEYLISISGAGDYRVYTGKLVGQDEYSYFMWTKKPVISNNNCNCLSLSVTLKDSGYLVGINKDLSLQVEEYSAIRYRANEYFTGASIISSLVLFLSPLASIDYRQGKFNGQRYFAINKVALPLFAVSLTGLFMTYEKEYTITRDPSKKGKKILLAR